jgi:hypothetical protein
MRNDEILKASGLSLLLLLASWGSYAPLQLANRPTEQPVLVAHSAVDIMQAGNMAGYVLNNEMGMNRVYGQRINRDLLNPPGSEVEGPLIQYVGPLPQSPPIGPIYQRSTQARPLAPRQGL